MMYKRETRADYGTGKREYVEFTERNANGETIAVELATALEELSTATVWEAE